MECFFKKKHLLNSIQKKFILSHFLKWKHRLDDSLCSQATGRRDTLNYVTVCILGCVPRSTLTAVTTLKPQWLNPVKAPFCSHHSPWPRCLQSPAVSSTLPALCLSISQLCFPLNWFYPSAPTPPPHSDVEKLLDRIVLIPGNLSGRTASLFASNSHKNVQRPLWINVVYPDFPVVARLEYTDQPGYGHLPRSGFKGILGREMMWKTGNSLTV